MIQVSTFKRFKIKERYRWPTRPHHLKEYFFRALQIRKTLFLDNFAFFHFHRKLWVLNTVVRLVLYQVLLTFFCRILKSHKITREKEPTLEKIISAAGTTPVNPGGLLGKIHSILQYTPPPQQTHSVDISEATTSPSLSANQSRRRIGLADQSKVGKDCGS